MATDIHNSPARRKAVTQRGFRSICSALGSLVCGLFASLRLALGRVFVFRARVRRIPVIHENVTLTPEGAKVWEQVADPASPVGKPVRHRRRRLAEEHEAI